MSTKQEAELLLLTGELKATVDAVIKENDQLRQQVEQLTQRAETSAKKVESLLYENAQLKQRIEQPQAENERLKTHLQEALLSLDLALPSSVAERNHVMTDGFIYTSPYNDLNSQAAKEER